jgi:hypothetical protein
VLEAEIDEFLGRGRYQRTAKTPEARPGMRNGYQGFVCFEDGLAPAGGWDSGRLGHPTLHTSRRDRRRKPAYQLKPAW